MGFRIWGLGFRVAGFEFLLLGVFRALGLAHPSAPQPLHIQCQRKLRSIIPRV